MKLRASHLVLLVVVLVGGFVVFAAIRAKNPTPSVDDNADFLETVRVMRDEGIGSTVADGSLKGIDQDPNSIPSISIPVEDFDMGEIANTEPTVKQIKIGNTGKGPLEITDIQTTCGCTTGYFDDVVVRSDGRKVTVIPAGSEMPMNIKVDPDRIPGFHAHKTLTIYSNDPNRPAASLDVTTHVIPEYELEPEELDFGVVQKTEPSEKSIIVRQTANCPTFELTGVEPGARVFPIHRRGGSTPAEDTANALPQYEVNFEKRPQEFWKTPTLAEWEIRIKLTPEVPIGKFADAISITSNVHRVDKVPVRFNAEVQAFYSVDPDTIGVRGAVQPGQKSIAKVSVKGTGPLEIEDLTITGDSFVPSLVHGDKPEAAEISVDVSSSATAGLKNETLSFTVKSGDKSLRHTMRTFASVRTGS